MPVMKNHCKKLECMAIIYLPTPKWCSQDEKSLCYEWVHDTARGHFEEQVYEDIK